MTTKGVLTTETALDMVEECVGEMRKPYIKALENDRENIKTLYQTKHYTLLYPLTPCGDTVFHIAAYMGSKDLLQDLFNMVAMPRKCEVLTKKNSHGNTLLHEVVMSNNVEAAQFLVDEIAHDGRAKILMDRNNLGETALYRAAAFGNTATVEYLVEKVKNGNLKDDHFKRTSDGLSILHIAIMNEKFETAIWLLEKYRELATEKYRGKTCLHILASMPTAFKSSSSIMYGLEIIYRYIPGILVDGDESQSSKRRIRCLTVIKNICLTKYCDLWTYLAEKWNFIKEIVETKKKHRFAVKLAKKLLEMNSSMWREYQNEQGHDNIICFSGDEETREPSSHATCIGTKAICTGATAKMLVKVDSSMWGEYHNEEGHNNIICFSGDRKKGGKETGEAPFQTGCDGTVATIEAAPDTPLIIASRTGIEEIVAKVIKVYPQALEHVTRRGQNILHVAILHRNHHILDLIKSESEVVTRRLVLGIDNDGDTILHKAACTKYYSGGTTSTAALKLQEELRWFREMEKMVPPHYTIHLNKDHRTAKQLLKDEHKEQLKEAQEWVKNTSQSCSTVAILVATVLFAAAFSVPGGFIGYNDAKEATASPPTGATANPPTGAAGTAVLADKPLYSFFVVMDVAGLACSLTSVVLFLSVLTSSLDLEEFHYQIPSKLSAGFLFLSFSIGTTLLSFTAATLLTFHLSGPWTTSLTYAAAFLPVSIYAIVQFGLYFAYLKSALIGIFRLVKLLLPGN